MLIFALLTTALSFFFFFFFLSSSYVSVEIPGLAHFIEHMLFLGTKNHPEENRFSARVSQGGGSSNAYTRYVLFFLSFHIFRLILTTFPFDPSNLHQKALMKLVIISRFMITFGRC